MFAMEVHQYDVETGRQWVVVVSGDTLEECYRQVQEMMAAMAGPETLNPFEVEAADPLRLFIASLPEDCRESMNLLFVFQMFQIDRANVFEKDSPHTREAIIREIRRRDYQK